MKQKVKYSVLYASKRYLHHTILYSKCTRAILSVILVILILFFLTGQGKYIFRSNSHIPWLTDVKHIQPLECISNTNQSQWPHPVQFGDKLDSNLTVVIVTARPEFKRLPVTFATLLCHLDFRRITEVMFLVPPKDVHLLQSYFSSEKPKQWPWPISLISDDILLKHIHTHSYRLQMMFKLFLAQIIRTEYYLILDSDCLAIWPIHVEQLLYEDKNLSIYKAAYQIEGKSGHVTWWAASERLAQITLESCVSTDKSSTPTMGVTPSILSRTIALRTLCRLQKLYGDEKFLNKMANWALERTLFGHMWTEYTLYFLTARCTQIFDRYHFHHSALLSSSSIPALNLYGLSIWSLGDWSTKNQNRLVELINKGLKWRQKEMKEANGQAIIDKSIDIHSLFSVLQGRHGVDPKFYHELFYPLYINYLQQQNQTKQLISILNTMVKNLMSE